MNRYSMFFIGFFSIFCLGCVKQNNPTQISEDNKLQKKYQESREREEQEFQAMFRNKKWMVLSVEEYDSSNDYKWLLFETFDGGYFRSSVDSVSVVLDKSLSGTHLVVSGVGRSMFLSVRNNRYVNQAILHVSTEANKLRWDNYLKNRKEEIEKSESPRKVLPAGKSK